MDVQQIRERVAEWRPNEIEVDEESRIVRGIALIGPESANGYQYPGDTLAAAAPLYASAPVFLDHTQRGEAPLDRSVRDYVGHVTNPRLQGGRIYGDISVAKNAAGDEFLALASSENTPGIGMSHVILGKRSIDGTRMESIYKVVSVDCVCFPATTKSLSESVSPSVDVSMPVMATGESVPVGLSEVAETIASRIAREVEDQSSDAEIDALVDRLYREVCEAFEERRRSEIERMFKRARLPYAEAKPFLDNPDRSIDSAKDYLIERLARKMGIWQGETTETVKTSNDWVEPETGEEAYRLEYVQNREALAAMGVDETAYV